MVSVEPGSTQVVPDVLVQRLAVQQATAGALLVETRPAAMAPLVVATTRIAGREDRAPEVFPAVPVDGTSLQYLPLGVLGATASPLDLLLLNLGAGACGAGIETTAEPRSFDLPPWGVARAASMVAPRAVRAATASGARCPLAVLAASRCGDSPDPTVAVLLRRGACTGWRW